MSYLQMLVEKPREDLDREYKDWLDLRDKENKGKLAKAAIAMVNYGGGFIIIGFEEQGSDFLSHECPSDIPLITQDSVNNVISAYADPSFHCIVQNIRTSAGTSHVVISTPSTLAMPVIAKRGTEGKSIIKDYCYVRKPGPRSECCTSEDWRDLLRRCVLADRDRLLESLRSIMSNRTEAKALVPTAFDKLKDFCVDANKRWRELISGQAENSPARFPLGYYEMGFSLIDADQASNLTILQDRLRVARKTKFTGWPPFLDPSSSDSHPYNNFVELQIKHSNLHSDLALRPSLQDFWRAAPDGTLYTIRGYAEDDNKDYAGKMIAVNIPVWRVGEGILFASRFARTYENIEQIAIRCRFTALNGRCLFENLREPMMLERYISQTDEIIVQQQVSLQQIQDNLPEILHQLLAPLYEKFDFYKLSLDLVQDELQKMRRIVF